MIEEESYFAVFWTRWKVLDVIELEEVFRKEGFAVSRPKWIVPDPFYDFELGGHLTRYEIRVVADSLHALLSSVRAVLFQQNPRTFTLRDDKLYDIVHKVYYRNRRMLPFLPRVEEGIKWRLHL